MSTSNYRGRPKPRSKSAADTDNESQPLLSSDVSRTSIVHGCMFYESETSDFEPTLWSTSPSLPQSKILINRDHHSLGTLGMRGFAPASRKTKSDRLHTFMRPYTSDIERISDTQYYSKANYDSIFSVSSEQESGLNKIFVEEPTKQNSLVTVFAIWNTMMGTSLLAMPWGIERAGLLVGVSLIIIMGALCLYTTLCVMKTQKSFGQTDGEISDLAKVMLGHTAQLLAKIFSWIVLLGANIVYWILMSNFLFYSVDYMHNTFFDGMNKGSNISSFTDISFPVTCPRIEQAINKSVVADTSIYHKVWSLDSTVPVFLAVLITPLLSFKSATFFTKFNSFGTLSVFYIIVFVLWKGISWGVNINMSTITNPLYSPWISSSFPATSGMLALSFFIQNIVITVMRSNKDQQNNSRDLSIAYFLVILTYVIIGAVFYVTFPLPKACIEDNLLNNFPSWDILTVLARVFLFFQLLTVFPLISFMLRVQVMTTFFSNEYPSRSIILSFNAIVVIICILFAVFLPRIGTVIRFTGALSGFFHVFTLPCLLRLAAEKKKEQLTTTSIILHLVIPVIGAINLAAQFFVSDY